MEYNLSNLTNTMFWNNLNIIDNVIIDNLECPNVDRSLFGNLQFKDGTVFIIGDSTGIKVQSRVESLGLKYDILRQKILIFSPKIFF